MVPICMIGALIAGQPGETPNLHPWLAKAIADRSGQTSHVDFAVQSHYSVNEGRVEHYTTETVGDSFYQSRDDRDPPGMIYSVDTGIPGRASPELTESISWEGNWLFSHESREERELRLNREKGWPTDVARLYGRYVRPNRRDGGQGIDPRFLGLGPRIGRGPGILGPIRTGSENEFAGFTWTESSDGVNDILRADAGDGKSIVWRFSREKGHQPVRVEWLALGTVLYHSETELQEVDGRWIPRTVRVYEDYHNSGLDPLKTVTVTGASFDKPGHRQEPFTPEEIGVVFGTQIQANTLETGPTFGTWNGLGFVTWEEHFDLHLGWGLDYHPDLAKRLWGEGGQEAYESKLAIQRKAYLEEYEAKHGHPHPSLLVVQQTNEQDEWDLYVAAFIEKHELDEPRTERAGDLLDRAKKLRDHYRRKNRSDQRKAEAEGDAAKLEHIAAIEERIFNRVLKRGLEKLQPRQDRPKDKGD